MHYSEAVTIATLEDEHTAEIVKPTVERRSVSMRERLLAGLCASLMVLSIAAAVTHASDADTRPSQQLVAGPAEDQPPVDPPANNVAPTGESIAAAAAAAETATPRSPLGPLGPPPARPGGASSLVATAAVASVDVYSSAGASAPASKLANPQPSGAPLVMLVREQQAGWAKVLLPVRPNGSSGWVKTDQVKITSTEYLILIGLGAHRITAFSGNSVVLDERIGLGAGGTPTPTGLFYIKELLQPPNPAGAYGPFAYGLSAFSNVLFSFGGGPGTVGIHGTNDPSSLGRNVSAGCIRMSNAGVTRLAKMLPLGVTVQITA